MIISKDDLKLIFVDEDKVSLVNIDGGITWNYNKTTLTYVRSSSPERVEFMATGNVLVEWGDGSVSRGKSETGQNYSHQYSSKFDTINIYGAIVLWGFREGGSSSYNSLQRVEFGEGVAQIGGIEGQKNLREVIFPQNSKLNTIPDYAFYGCSSLTNISIPQSVSSIGANIFRGCSSLQNIEIPFIGWSSGYTPYMYERLLGYFFGDIEYDGGVPVTQIYNGGEYTYYIPESLRSVTITRGNNGVLGYWALVYGALSQCSMLTSAIIGDNITQIQESAFENCSGITSVTIPNSITNIGENAFYKCANLQNIIIKNVTGINMPDSVVAIGQRAFWGCSSLTAINFGENSQLTTIGSSAFRGCTSLENITIAKNVEVINMYAFAGCTNLTSITIMATTPPTLSSTNAFTDTNDCSIYVPSGSVDAYKAADKWSSLASRIVAM